MKSYVLESHMTPCTQDSMKSHTTEYTRERMKSPMTSYTRENTKSPITYYAKHSPVRQKSYDVVYKRKQGESLTWYTRKRPMTPYKQDNIQSSETLNTRKHKVSGPMTPVG